MKKFLFLTFLMSFFFTQTAFAQQVICNAKGITVNYKRTIVKGNTVTIQFTVANNCGQNLEPLLHGEEPTRYDVQKAEAFDDQGNYYDLNSKNMSVSIGDATIAGSIYSSEHFSLANETMLKGEITINNIDEYATSFSKINIPLRLFNIADDIYQRGYITFKNVPIPKN